MIHNKTITYPALSSHCKLSVKRAPDMPSLLYLLHFTFCDKKIKVSIGRKNIIRLNWSLNGNGWYNSYYTFHTYRNRMAISYDFLRKYSLYLVLCKRSYPIIYETFYHPKNRIRVNVESHWSISCRFYFCLKSHFLITTYNWYFTLYCTAFESVDWKPRIFFYLWFVFRLGKYWMNEKTLRHA